jgi:uncharacterized RDD family membrane protein YckC
MSRLFRGGNNASGWSHPVRDGAAPAGSYAGVVTTDVPPASQHRVRGASLGLPAEGPGALAPFGTRAVAFLVDAISAALVAGLFTAPEMPGLWSSLVFAVLTILTLVAFGQTPGMRRFGLRLAHPEQGQRLAAWRAVVRTALLMLLVPALVVDADGRGLHDRLTRTAVVRD